jgi:hypothetical protein
MLVFTVKGLKDGIVQGRERLAAFNFDSAADNLIAFGERFGNRAVDEANFQTVNTPPLTVCLPAWLGYLAFHKTGPPIHAILTTFVGIM